ncbi:glycolate oxidase [Sphingobium xenophagum]|uniref:Glycolate oxidase n=1 Tax=Sphingobium xenophagum TaxID=121428 RepID=A0ABU1X5I4_SPHXE|nr:FAD-binding oxidoreductase [Sphingobium xenophagum]MDR7156835.1 glycolate oxidase [Sphingobium xenophagum]
MDLASANAGGGIRPANFAAPEVKGGSKSRSRLSGAARQELIEILGPRGFSDDPAVIAGYAWVTTTGGTPSSKQIYKIRPEAILLPNSTEEVQAIVRACLRHGVKYRAHSTGMGSFSGVTQEGVVSLDLRRMDKIVEMDQRNQLAVIEPYVTAAQLQAEAMKVGLTPHIIGAGWTHSPLASATSGGGIGITGNHTGYNARNLMAWEWVTPEGDVVRSGSAGAGTGWFAGEGPGPGFRGMIRGQAGAFGSLGVFTRIGYKLHPWAGPTSLDHRGQHPQLGIPLSDTLRLYQVAWPDWKGPRDAAYELMASNAATFIVRLPPDQYGWILYSTNREYYEHVKNGTLPEVARTENRISWTLVAVSGSQAEAEWRDRTIRSIVERTGGRELDLAPEHAEIIARNSITSCYSPRAYRSGPRQVLTSVGVYNSVGLLPQVVQTSERLMAPYKEKRHTFSEGSPEEFWLWLSEGRHLWGENIVACDNDTSRSGGDGFAFVLQTMDENSRSPLGTAAFALGSLFADIYGQRFGLNRLMRKIKSEFDPHSAADGIYPSGKPEMTARMWPLARLLLFGIPALLRLVMRIQLKLGK